MLRRHSKSFQHLRACRGLVSCPICQPPGFRGLGQGYELSIPTLFKCLSLNIQMMHYMIQYIYVYIQYNTIHYLTLHYITLPCLALPYLTLPYIHYITLHYMALHYITLH